MVFVAKTDVVDEWLAEGNSGANAHQIHDRVQRLNFPPPEIPMTAGRP